MKDSDILQAASDVILNGFTKEVYARCYDGRLTSPADTEAAQFCMVGATMRAMGGTVNQADAVLDRWVVPLIPKRKLHTMEFPGLVRSWNDDPASSQQAVALMLISGAAEARAKGA